MIEIPLKVNILTDDTVYYDSIVTLKRHLIFKLYSLSKDIQQFFILPQNIEILDEPYLIFKTKENQTDGYILKVDCSTLTGDTVNFGQSFYWTLDLYYAPDINIIDNNELILVCKDFCGDCFTPYNKTQVYNYTFFKEFIIIPISSNCEALIFINNQARLFPYTVFLRYNKNNEYYFAFFICQPKQSSNYDNRLIKNLDDERINTDGLFAIELYSTKYGRTSKSRTGSGIVQGTFLYNYDLNSIVERQYFPLRIGDVFIPDVWILNGGTSLDNNVSFPIINNVEYYSVFKNILIKNNQLDTMWETKMENYELDNPFEKESEYLLYNSTFVNEQAEGIYFIFRNVDEQDRTIKVYKNDILYRTYLLPKKSKVLTSDFSIDGTLVNGNGIIYNTHGDTPILIKCSLNDKIKITYTGVFTKYLRIVYDNMNFSQKNLTSDAQNTLLLENVLYDDEGSTIIERKSIRKTDNKKIYYINVGNPITDARRDYDLNFIALSKNQDFGLTLVNTVQNENNYIKVLSQNELNTVFTISFGDKSYYAKTSYWTIQKRHSSNQRDEMNYNYSPFSFRIFLRPTGRNSSIYYQTVTNYIETINFDSFFHLEYKNPIMADNNVLPDELDTYIIGDNNYYSDQGVKKIYNPMLMPCMTTHLGTKDFTGSAAANNNWFSPEAAYNLIMLIEDWEDQNNSQGGD